MFRCLCFLAVSFVCIFPARLTKFNEFHTTKYLNGMVAVAAMANAELCLFLYCSIFFLLYSVHSLYL